MHRAARARRQRRVGPQSARRLVLAAVHEGALEAAVELAIVSAPAKLAIDGGISDLLGARAASSICSSARRRPSSIIFAAVPCGRRPLQGASEAETDERDSPLGRRDVVTPRTGVQTFFPASRGESPFLPLNFHFFGADAAGAGAAAPASDEGAQPIRVVGAVCEVCGRCARFVEDTVGATAGRGCAALLGSRDDLGAAPRGVRVWERSWNVGQTARGIACARLPFWAGKVPFLFLFAAVARRRGARARGSEKTSESFLPSTKPL